MATFRKRSNSWQARVQLSGCLDQSKSFKSYAEAVAWARKIESDIDSGTSKHLISANNKVLLRELLERYKQEVTCHKKHASTEAYRVDFWLRHSLANLPIASIKSADIAKWRDERIKLGRAPNTLRLELAVLSNLFTVAAHEWGYEWLANPTTKVKLPKLPSGRVRRLTEQELAMIVSNSESMLLKNIVSLAVETAMRRSEIVRIEGKNINLGKRTLLIPVTKNGEAREIPLSPVALALFERLNYQDSDRVFNITPHGITVAFGRACKRSEMEDTHFHDYGLHPLY